MAQQTDEQLRQEATVITTETTPGANTANRVGTMFTNSIDSKINNDVISASTALGSSDSLIPTQNAVKTYVDGSVVGLLDDRGNYIPGATVGSPYPSSGGSGAGGAIRKGDLWFIAANGYLLDVAVSTGASVRALVDNPDDATESDWNILNTGLGFTPENVANKSTNVALGTSNILYPTQNAVKTYVDNSNFASLSDDNTFNNVNTFQGFSIFQADVNIDANISFGNYPLNINSSTGTAGQILTSQGGAAAPTWEENAAASLSGDNTFTGNNTFAGNNLFTNTNEFFSTVQFNEVATLSAGMGLGNILSAGTSGPGTVGQVLTSQGSSTAPIWANVTTPSAWNLTGNSGTTPGTNFIGTTDNKNLIFKTNGTEKLKIESGGDIYAKNNIKIVADTNGQSTSIQTYQPTGFFSASVGQDSSRGGFLQINGTTGFNEASLLAQNLTSPRTYQFPNASGTLALRSDIPTSLGWGLTGNSGTTPGADFIGTTDNKDVVFKRNNVEFLKLDSTYGLLTNKLITSSGTSTYITAASSVNPNKNVALGFDSSISDNAGHIGFGNGTTSALAYLLADNITANRNIQLPNASGTLALTSDIPTSGWGLTGNSGTTPGTNFIGTTDNKDVVFKRNNQEQLSLTSISGTDTVKASVNLLSVGNQNEIRVQSSLSSAEFAVISCNTTDKGFLSLGNGTGTGILKSTNVTGFKTYEFPNANGTLALEDYLVYTALLSFDSTTVTATILKNTLGATLNWTNPSNGLFRGEIVMGTPFTAKTWISVPNYNNAGSPYIPTGQRRNLFPTTTIDIYMFLHDGSLTGTPNVTNMPIEIRVYP